MNRIDEIIYEETQKAAYEDQCEHGFVHQNQPNEDYFECVNDYLNGTMSNLIQKKGEKVLWNRFRKMNSGS